MVTLNPEISMSCQQNLELRSIINDAAHLTADGAGIVMVSRLKGNPLPERVTGCDLLINLLEMGNKKCWSFYLLGASELTSKKASEVINMKYPNVSILGRYHGFFDHREEARIVDEITNLRPDVLVVALGAPKAEFWIHKFKNTLNARVAIGVGGSLDTIAGTVKRAPVIWQKINLEWLYRLIKQPSRWKRQLILPRFAMKALFFKENCNGPTKD
ncbi:WecB/TagA/CpsF family glycosyltransferase [Paenibacillus sp. 2TAB26]|uniref:WecB/TagA/CpsF family glycosyltransferase n=1 Tax=Paenibacillus sp. 2TAB26 TaxID=3233005 RepID=UPI003F99CEC8